MTTTHRYQFFLGGADLEMETINTLLGKDGQLVVNKHVDWSSALASSYRDEIDAAYRARLTPVLIELRDDLDLDRATVIIIDHHAERAGSEAPTSLEQVFNLLEWPASAWTRDCELVAANDRGYIEGMQAIGATEQQMRDIRARDRAAQGITAREEREAHEAAVARMQSANGLLTTVHLPHARTAAVTDRLHPALGGPGYRNLLIESPREINVYANGQLIEALNTRFEGGWYGGSLPVQGFWGHSTAAFEDVKNFLEATLTD